MRDLAQKKGEIGILEFRTAVRQAAQKAANLKRTDLPGKEQNCRAGETFERGVAVFTKEGSRGGE